MNGIPRINKNPAAAFAAAGFLYEGIETQYKIKRRLHICEE
jgi:hypothetical protein